MRDAVLPASRSLLAAAAFLLLAGAAGGCASMPEASEQTPQDMSASAAQAPAPSDLRASGARPLPQDPAPAAGYAEARERGTRSASGRPGPDYWQQEVDYDLTARIYPEARPRLLEGTATITYTNNAPDTLARVRLELAQNHHAPGVVRNEPAEVTGGVRLERVAVNGMGLPEGAGDGPRYRVENTQLVVIPPAPLTPGAQATIEVEWSFEIPQAGAGGRMGYSDGLLFLAYWYPQVSVYDDVTGWMEDPFRGRGEFYADFATYDVRVDAPEGWLVQSTGRLQNADAVLAKPVLERRRRAYRSDAPVEILSPDDTVRTADAPDDRLTWHFTADRVRDVAFSATRGGYWEAARAPVGDRDGDGTVDSTRVNTFWRASAPKWAEVTRYQQHALTHLSDTLGRPYPWPHMTAVEGGGIIGGGMEFPMMTLMGDYTDRSARGLYAVTAHELAHMWVPMIVSTNERRYAFLDEGLTSFNENVARGAFFSGSDAIASDREDYLRVARAGREGAMIEWTDFYRDGTAFVTAAYRKPATVLAALRGLLGEDTFREAVRTFVDDWAYKHPYPTDFFNTVERVSGRELDWFWSAWYHTTWTLDQAVGRVEGSGGQTSITVEDRGRVPMPARITVTTTGGRRVERTLPVDVWLQGRTSATVTVDVSRSRIARIEIDPDYAFPDVDRSNNSWSP
jgi:hypothetical protein